MLSRALVVFQSANRWHCESHGFPVFFIFFFLCLPTLFFLFDVPRPPPPVLPLTVTYKYAKRSRPGGGGDVCFTKNSEDVLSGRGVKSLPKRPDLLRLGAGLGLPWLR